GRFGGLGAADAELVEDLAEETHGCSPEIGRSAQLDAGIEAWRCGTASRVYLAACRPGCGFGMRRAARHRRSSPVAGPARPVQVSSPRLRQGMRARPLPGA